MRWQRLGLQSSNVSGARMEVLTASFGFCIGINRAYRGMNERALKEAPFTVAHQNSNNEFDTLRRIERRDPALLERYPGLNQVAVTHNVEELDQGDRLVLGFHGLPSRSEERRVGKEARWRWR